jgi:hypothetical protein
MNVVEILSWVLVGLIAWGFLMTVIYALYTQPIMQLAAGETIV